MQYVIAIKHNIMKQQERNTITATIITIVIIMLANITGHLYLLHLGIIVLFFNNLINN